MAVKTSGSRGGKGPAWAGLHSETQTQKIKRNGGHMKWLLYWLSVGSSLDIAKDQRKLFDL
jgi:hypothetical protein